MAKLCNKYWHCLFAPNQKTDGCPSADICPHFQEHHIRSFDWSKTNLDMANFTKIHTNKKDGITYHDD